MLTTAKRNQIDKAARPISRSPYGGMSINQKDYAAGQFLPGRRVYAQEEVHESEAVLPPSLNHKHLKTLDLHKVEPTWDKRGHETRNAYGGVILNKHGHILMVEPTNHFGGYVWTFPKGGIDPGEHPVEGGLREVNEETGHDASIMGLVPKRFLSPSGAGYAHYFLMRSHGQTGDPDWETNSMRWASPEEAHKLIDKTYNFGGRRRDHDILDTALNHLAQMKANPDINSHLQPSVRRKLYEKSACDGHCGCSKCAATQTLDHIIYSRSERYRKDRIRRILYESSLV